MDIVWTPRSVGPLFGLLSPEKQQNNLTNERIRINSSPLSTPVVHAVPSPSSSFVSSSSASSPYRQSLRVAENLTIPSNNAVSPRHRPSSSASSSSSSPRRTMDYISPRNLQEVANRKQWNDSQTRSSTTNYSNEYMAPSSSSLSSPSFASVSSSVTSSSPRSSIRKDLKQSSSGMSSSSSIPSSSSRPNPKSTTGKNNSSSPLSRKPSSFAMNRDKNTISSSSSSSFSPSSSSSATTNRRTITVPILFASSPLTLPPAQHNYISPSKQTPASSFSSPTHNPNTIIEPVPLAEDIGIEVSLQAYLVSGSINENFVGAYGYFASYDELPIPIGPNGYSRTVKDSFTITQSTVPNSIFSHHTLRGSHAARLELHNNGIFRARLTHQAAGPSANDRSINIDAVGKWVFLPGSSKIVLIPDDRTMRIDIRPLPGSETEEVNNEIQRKYEMNGEKDEGPPGGARVTLNDAQTGLLLAIHKGGVQHNPELPLTREWISLQYPVFRVPS